MKFFHKKGFTLIELLVVIGILAILLAITLIAINPARQFGSANDTRRKSDILQVLNAVHQYAAENQGNLPPEIDTLVDNTPTVLNNTNFPNLCLQLVTDYLPAFPTDPSLNTANITDCTTDAAGSWGFTTGVTTTGYEIEKDAADRIKVIAPNAETPPIEVTR